MSTSVTLGQRHQIESPACRFHSRTETLTLQRMVCPVSVFVIKAAVLTLKWYSFQTILILDNNQ